MKRLHIILLCVVVLMVICVAGASAAVDEWGNCGKNGDSNLTYTLDYETGILTISGSGEMEDYYPGTGTFEYYDKNYGKIKQVILPDGLTSIGRAAFCNLSELTELEIPDTVTSIGANAFQYSGLESIELPESVESVGESAFFACDALKDVTFLNGETEIASSSWNDFPNSLTIHTPCTSQAVRAFAVQNRIPYELIHHYVDDECSICHGVPGGDVPEVIASGDCGKDGSNVTWSLNYLRTLTISGTGEMADYSFQKRAPWEELYPEKIIIDHGITSIGESAFMYSYNYMSEVTISDTVTSIGDYAFFNSNGLIRVEIPDNVNSIGASAFYACNGLTDASILNGEAYIGSSAFPTDITIHTPCVSSGTSVVMQYANENSISLELIHSYDNDGACAVCGDQISPQGGDGDPTIVSSGTCGAEGENGDNLTWTMNDQGVLTITGTGAMEDYDEYHCSWSRWDVTSVVIENGVTSIGDYAFYESNSLTDVTIPNTVTSIGTCAFSYCDGLESVSIPANVTSMGEYAFSMFTTLYMPCDSAVLATATAEGNTCIIEHGSIDDNGQCEICGFDEDIVSYGSCGENVDWTLSDSGVLTIYGEGPMQEEAFATSGFGQAPWGKDIRQINIQEGVTSISQNTAYECGNLIDVTLPESVSYVSEYAFHYCDNMISVTVLNGDATIGDMAFPYGVTIYTPCAASEDSPTAVMQYAEDNYITCQLIHDFSNGTCTRCGIQGGYCGAEGENGDNLTWTLEGTSLTIFGNGAMADFDNSHNASPWGTDITQVSINGGVTSIGGYAFWNCLNLADVWIADSVTSIGDYAFSKCQALTGIYLPYGLQSIGAYAFDHCTGLGSLNIPGSVSSIGSYAFSYSGLTSFIWPENTTSISGGAFKNCTKLESIVIPEGVTVIGSFAFEYCHMLESIELPQSVEDINSSAFIGSDQLTSVLILNSSATIGPDAFSGCPSALTIYTPCYPGTAVSTWAANPNNNISCELIHGYSDGNGHCRYHNSVSILDEGSDPKPSISISNANNVKRGEYVKITVTTPPDTTNLDPPVDSNEIYYRAYVVREFGSVANYGDILAEGWGGADEILLSTYKLPENETYDIYVQACQWDGADHVPVGTPSNPVRVTITKGTGEGEIVFSTNRGSSTEAPNPITFGQGVEFTVYAPGSYQIVVYCSNGEVWRYHDSQIEDGYRSTDDFDLRAVAYYSEDDGTGNSYTRSVTLSFDVSDPAGFMSDFDCELDTNATDTPYDEVRFESDSSPYGPFAVHFDTSIPKITNPVTHEVTNVNIGDNKITYQLLIWDMMDGDDKPEYESVLHLSAADNADPDKRVFTVNDDTLMAMDLYLRDGHIYRVEVTSEYEDDSGLYQGATAQATFIAKYTQAETPAHQPTFEILNKDGDAILDDNNQPLTEYTFAVGEPFVIHINAAGAYDVSIFNGDEFDYLKQHGEWGSSSWWDGNAHQTVEYHGWNEHPEDIKLEYAKFNPGVYLFYVSAKYEDSPGDDFSSTPIKVTITTQGHLSAPSFTVATDEVEKGDLIRIELTDWDRNSEYFRATVLNDDPDEFHQELCCVDMDWPMGDPQTITLCVPTVGENNAMMPGHTYRIWVENMADGWQSGGGNAFVTITAPESQEDDEVFLAASKDAVDGVIHLEPHEAVTLSAYAPKGDWLSSRIEVWVNGEPDWNYTANGNYFFTNELGWDRNGTYNVEVRYWHWWYDNNPDYNFLTDTATLTFKVEGGEMNPIPNVSVDPELMLLDDENGPDPFTLSFDAVTTKIKDENDTEIIVEQAEWYCVNVGKVLDDGSCDWIYQHNVDPRQIDDDAQVTFKENTVADNGVDGTYAVTIPLSLTYPNNYYDEGRRGQPIFEPGYAYRFNVSAFAPGLSTSDGEAMAVVMDEADNRVSISLIAADGDTSLQPDNKGIYQCEPNTLYWVFISCVPSQQEGAEDFRFFDGESWRNPREYELYSEGHEYDYLSYATFHFWTGDSQTLYLSAQGKFFDPEAERPAEYEDNSWQYAWVQGNVLNVNVEAQEGNVLGANNLCYELYAGVIDQEHKLTLENGKYTITRGTPLLIDFPYVPDDDYPDKVEADYSRYGAHMITDGGRWLDYFHWDDQERRILYPTTDLEGDYQLRVAVTANGYDSYAEYVPITVRNVDEGVLISLDYDETVTCQNNPIRVYAPGADSVGVYIRMNGWDHSEEVCQLSATGGTYRDYGRGASGIYQIWAVADYDKGSENERSVYSEYLTWRVTAPNGSLARQSITLDNAPSGILPTNTPLQFTVAKVVNAENACIRVYEQGNEDNCFLEENRLEECQGTFFVDTNYTDDDGNKYQFEDGHTYIVMAYASATGYNDSYCEVPFVVSNQTADDITITVLDQDTGAVVEPNEQTQKIELLAGHGYKIRITGTQQVDYIEFSDGTGGSNNWGQFYPSYFDDGDVWSATYPAYDNANWSSPGGTYILRVRVWKDDQFHYAGLPVTVISNGTLNEPYLRFLEPKQDPSPDEDPWNEVATTTVTRGEPLRVRVGELDPNHQHNLDNEHCEVRICGSHDGWENSEKLCEFYGTGDFELPTANLCTTWQDEYDPEADPVPMAYRVEVNVGADGWEGNWTCAVFTVEEPVPGDEPVPMLLVSNADDLWIHEKLNASVYAPGAVDTWLEIDGRETNYDSRDPEYFIGGDDMHDAGLFTVVGVAEYEVVNSETQATETVTRYSKPQTVEVKSLGRIDAPVINAPVTLGEHDDFTFSFNYSTLSNLDGNALDNSFDVEDRYSWSVQRLEYYEYGGEYWNEIFSYKQNGELRGNADAHAPITITADDGYAWEEGAIYRVEVNVWGNHCDGNNESVTILCTETEADESITLRITSGGQTLSADNNDPDFVNEIPLNQPMAINVTLLRGADRLEIYDGTWSDLLVCDPYNSDESLFGDELEYLGYYLSQGQYNLMVRAHYPDGTTLLSNSISVRVVCNGKLTAPEVRFGEDFDTAQTTATVPRGAFLDVNIGGVEHAADNGYSLRVFGWNGNEGYWDNDDQANMYRRDLPCGLNRLSTAELAPGRYQVRAWVRGIGWEDSNYGKAEFTVEAPQFPQNEDFIISVSNDHPMTCEDWTVSAIYSGSDERVNYVQIVRDDDCPTRTNGDNPGHLEGPDCAWATWSSNRAEDVVVYVVAGTESYNNEFERQFEEVLRSEPITIHVTANDDLDTPVIANLTPEFLNLNANPAPEELSMRVTVDDSLDCFSLNIYTDNSSDGMPCYSENIAYVKDMVTDDETGQEVEQYMTVTIPLNEISGIYDVYDGDTVTYRVEVYTCAYGWNEASVEQRFVVTREEVADDITMLLMAPADADDLWVNQEFQVAVSAPGAVGLQLRRDDDGGNGDHRDDASEWVFSLMMPSGSHAIWVEAQYEVPDPNDESGMTRVWRASAPMILNIRSNGSLDAPAVSLPEPEVPEAPYMVARGRNLPVTIGSVQYDETSIGENEQEMTVTRTASEYEVMIFKVDEDDRESQPMFSIRNITASEIASGAINVSTAALEPGRYHVKATAHEARYDDNWSLGTLFTVKENSGDTLIMNVSKTNVTTMEPWTVSAYMAGASIDLWIEEDNHTSFALYEFDRQSGDGYVQLSWQVYHAGTYTIHAMAHGDGELMYEAQETVVVSVEPGNDLGISLSNVPPLIYTGTRSVDIPVAVDEGVEKFDLQVEGDAVGQIYRRESIFTTDKDDNGVVTVTVPFDEGDLIPGLTYHVNVYTCRTGWNDAGDDVTFMATELVADDRITLTADPANDWTIAQPVWFCYEADGAEEIRLMQNGNQEDFACFEGPRYYQWPGAWDEYDTTFWVEARYGDEWKIGQPMSMHITSKGRLGVPTVTLPNNKDSIEVPRGTPLFISLGEVAGADRYNVDIAMDNGNVAEVWKFDKFGSVMIPTVGLEIGETYQIVPTALGDGYYNDLPQNQTLKTFTVTEPEDGAITFSVSDETVQVNEKLMISLFVKGAYFVNVSADNPDEQTQGNIWWGSTGDGFVFEREMDEAGTYTLYAWYTMDGNEWTRAAESIVITVEGSDNPLTEPRLTAPGSDTAPNTCAKGDTLCVTVSECQNADYYEVALIDENGNRVCFASSDKSGNIYIDTNDTEEGETYTYQITVRGKGYQAQTFTTEQMVTIGQPNEVRVVSPMINYNFLPVVRQGDVFCIEVTSTDPNAEQCVGSLKKIDDPENYWINVTPDEDGEIAFLTDGLAPGHYTLSVGNFADGCTPGVAEFGAIRIVDPDATLTLPSALKQIGEEAFTGIQAQIVIIPEGTTAIGARAFADCYNLGIVRIPDSVTSIDESAFQNCGMMVFECSADSTAAAYANSRGIFVDAPGE